MNTEQTVQQLIREAEEELRDIFEIGRAHV